MISLQDLPASTQNGLTSGNPAYFCTVAVISDRSIGIRVDVTFDADELTPPVQAFADVLTDHIAKLIQQFPRRTVEQIVGVHNDTCQPSLDVARIAVTLDQSGNDLVAFVPPRSLSPEFSHLTVVRNAGERIRGKITRALKGVGINGCCQ